MRRLILSLLLTVCGAAHAQVVPVYRTYNSIPLLKYSG